MKKLRAILDSTYYSFPVQLVIAQVRYHKFELLFWLVLFLITTGNFAEAMGVPYLFLEPEYMGESDFFSMFLLGMGMGTFVASYSISSYISDSFRFHFITHSDRPFFVFFFNNLLIPVFFLLTYSLCFIQFQSWDKGGFSLTVLLNLSGVYLGLIMVILLIVLYFFGTNRNFVHKIGERVVQDLKGGRVILARARAGMGIRNRVDYYFTGPFRTRQVNPSQNPDFRKLVKTLNQNHGNALFLELILLICILALGWLDQNPYFQIPAGTSIFLLFSVLLMLISAFTFWFRKIGPLFLILVLGLGYVWNVVDFGSGYKHPALGMNYEIPPVPYSEEAVNFHSSPTSIQSDLQLSQGILDHWKSDHHLYNGPYSKPKAIFVCTSGGGLRSAYFTVRIMQQLDSLSNGEFMKSTRLITGASGGMVGAAYYRELSLLENLGQVDHIYEKAYAQRMCLDMLNRVLVKMVTGIFVPTAQVQIGSSWYQDDRGWSFDQQLMQNLGVFQNRRLGDYTSLEELAVIPMMVFSPVVIHDGRKLYISATHVSYLTRELNFENDLEPTVSGLDFRRFFKNQDADSLLFATALRMNASFPVITPYVRLPSEPPLQVMDAGVADNFGLETASRYIQHFSKWLKANTSGVMLLQIRDSESPYIENQNLVSDQLKTIMNPIGGTFQAFYASSEWTSARQLHTMNQELDGDLNYVKMSYHLEDTTGVRASLSWHLTKREVAGLEESLQGEDIQSGMAKVKEWLAK